jgi:hypothetical protein
MSKAAAILVTELTIDDNRKVQSKTVAVPTRAITNIRESYLIVESASKDSDGEQVPCTDIISAYAIWSVKETPSRVATLMNEDEGADAIVKLLSEIDASLTVIGNQVKRLAANV